MGIGLLIALIGLQNAKLVVASPATMVAFGRIGAESLVAVFGLAVTAFLLVKRVRERS